MKSYNCFYSALFDVLEHQYRENTHLLINNRWQFFYNTNNDYSDDRRILGEHPLPFDKIHIEKLHGMCNIQIQIIKAQRGINELFEEVQKKGYVIVFANKHILSGLYKTSQEGRCVTTIKIDALQQDEVAYSVFDNNMPIIKIDLSLLENAWINASDYSILNKSIIDISIDETEISYESAKAFFWENLFFSIESYLEGPTMDEIIFGQKGLKAFVKTLCKWDIENPQKLIDCSMYIEFIIKQRKTICVALEYVCPNLYLAKTINKLYSIIEAWKKVRMFFFIIGKRGQYESLKFISDQINIIANEEYLFLKEFMKTVKDKVI